MLIQIDDSQVAVFGVAGSCRNLEASEMYRSRCNFSLGMVLDLFGEGLRMMKTVGIQRSSHNNLAMVCQKIQKEQDMKHTCGSNAFIDEINATLGCPFYVIDGYRRDKARTTVLSFA